jgi:hypothetical protein
MLLVDGDGDEAFARNRFEDDRGGEAAPSGEDGFTGGETLSELVSG